MVKIQLEISDEDREDFARQARMEGMLLDAWLVKVARQRVETPRPDKPAQFKSREEIYAFFREISGQDGPEWEPDWDEHLRNMDESIRKGLPDV